MLGLHDHSRTFRFTARSAIERDCQQQNRPLTVVDFDLDMAKFKGERLIGSLPNFSRQNDVE
jgi:hypothetical protein